MATRHVDRILLKHDDPTERRIDIWWWGDNTSRLMLLFAYLMTRHEDWKDARIQLVAVNYQEKTDENLKELAGILDEARIEAVPAIITGADVDVLAGFSKDADMIFAPFQFRQQQICDPFGGELQDLMARTDNVVLVKAAEDVQLDAEPEEGEAGEKAAALDALHDAIKKAGAAEKEAAEATAAAAEARKKLEKMQQQSADGALIEKLEKDVRETESIADKTARKAAKAQAKAEIAAKEAEAHGILVQGENDETTEEKNNKPPVKGGSNEAR
ncbi:MAG: hypothetical protein ISS65_03365 [Desulfobacterales bacterium]|uniref:SLC12A transporter C-terminal domain-containing protein n=1 Tax=Candidatus Desulfatibia profunda TaxID=2841695 RepID=A0A8J6TKD2_9BACT|nr:hypothetical protein [Candidatus Desulfatibia profunda]MBL7179234.1 hypothetical protein [Desulfobacterales bacterium]